MLLDPFDLKGLRLGCRIVRSATYEKRADADGWVTDSLIELYEELAQGGIGLMITGFALVHTSGRAAPQMISIHADSCIEGLKRLTDRVHAAGGLIAIQLVHGGRQCMPLMLGGEQPIAPSAVHDPSSDTTPREMTVDEIWRMVEAFGDAARRAEAAGFDAIQLHGAHGYLISGFLSPFTNLRDDYWGGDEARRFHFAEEVIKSVKDNIGYSTPLLVKVNCDDLLPCGLEYAEAARIAARMEAAGVDAIEISGGMRQAGTPTIRPGIVRELDEAYFRKAGALYKKTVSIPIILTGGMRTRSVMEDVLQSAEADLIGISRPLIREPRLPVLFREGKARADCISCNKCCRYHKLNHVRCKEIRQ